MRKNNLIAAVLSTIFAAVFATLFVVAPAYAQAAASVGGERTPQQPPPGFSASEKEEVAFVEPVLGDDDRIWRAVRKLIKTLHNEDMDGYLALFSERLLAHEKGSLESAIGFMSEVMATRGGIDRLHALSPQAIQVSDTRFPVRSVIFHLEDGTSGYFAVALDDDDKIDHYSFFIKRDLCSKGKRCDEATFSADEEHGAAN